MRFNLVLAASLYLSLTISGYARPGQDSPSSPNVNEQPPASTPPAQDAPAGQAAPTQTAPETSGSPSVSSPTSATDSGIEKKQPPTATSKVAKRRKHPARSSTSAPKKIIVREGGATEPAAQIAPGMSPEEATRERQSAEKWIGSTEDQLKQLAGRTLDTNKQETVGQIHNYMDGARSALKEGDVGRASTLAQKAHLLADDLVKH
jgi:hypothetical protein